MDDVIQNEWEKTIKVVIVSNEIWSMLFDDIDNSTHQSDRLLISIQMKRTATTYNIVFYTPLLGRYESVQMSFHCVGLLNVSMACTVVCTHQCGERVF